MEHFNACLNGETAPICDDSTLQGLIAKLEGLQEFELWINLEDGPSLTMLRNKGRAWLMYLRCSEDSGFHSQGPSQDGFTSFKLTNGQDDEYPNSWCIDLATCLEAIAAFVRHDGKMFDGVTWVED